MPWMSEGEPSPTNKKSAVALTVGSKVRVRSAGGQAQTIVSSGAYLGLVSIGGESSLSLELDDSAGSERGLLRLIPLNAVLSVDLIEVAKPAEETKRVEAANPGYFG
jgi:hypothetical protein